eukprot:TRINITY_DN34284_c0_g1_i1.p1 TRINITY_DN34284_c0_g1~~TRINITY_DN34284_c0_g1_i1.p1  ORF type:complete len:964 (+),score=130.54 TRINITY_DN34284_c0_g1_i1:49-2892(+)
MARSAIVAKLTSCLVKKSVRVIVSIFWFGLTLGGLLVAQGFIKSLDTTVPPAPGTQSQEAEALSHHYFPQKGLQAAFLVESNDGSPFVKFVEASTCTIQPTVTPTNKGIDVTFACHNVSAAALGGGCIRSDDFIREVLSSTEQLLKQFLDPAQAAKAMLMIKSELLPQLKQSMPNITRCPVAANKELTKDWLQFANYIEATLQSSLPGCISGVQTFTSIPEESVNKTIVVPLMGKPTPVALKTTLPSGTFWELLEHQLLANEGASTLLSATTATCDGKVVVPGSAKAEDVASVTRDIVKAAPTSMNVRVSSQTLMLDAIQGGIKDTMDLSTTTMPIALLILAVTAGNIRLVICTLVNLAVCIASSVLIMYPVAQRVSVSTTAPSLMVAIALAMSIDYSLFLLTRFQQEVKDGRRSTEAVEVMLATSGRIVLISGVTLLLCFLMMLTLPVQFIALMGVSAAVTVFMAVTAALSITPVMLLTFPSFFGSDRRFGLSLDGCCCRRRGATGLAQTAPECSSPLPRNARPEQVDSMRAAALESELEASCWPAFGKGIQKLRFPILIGLFAIAIPFAACSLPRFSHSAGLIPFMPSDAAATHTVIALQDAFGVGSIFPTSVILVPPPGKGISSNETLRNEWLLESCEALKSIADAVNTDPKVTPFTASAFTGVMMLNGQCTAKGFGSWSNVGGKFSATEVQITYAIDPFSAEGQRWIDRMRSAMKDHSSVASWYLAGEGPNQMDAANVTFARFPAFIALMMCIVLLLIGVAFRSSTAPLRAVLCLCWMLAITFGLAIFTFQDGWFSFLNWAQLGPRASGAMSWMSPCISGAVVVGLGLDYDIFYTERVLEECHNGYCEKEAAIRALGFTANTISAAGVIMAIAFAALLLCSTPSLNEIAFLLIVGVLIDCFITTKIIIPAALSLLGRYNFWPQSFSRPQLDCRDSRQAGVQCA